MYGFVLIFLRALDNILDKLARRDALRLLE